ncbi:MAG: 23S rRNA (adenine(2503)-C(2))-methyltransferase RlmN [Candidatus Moraniibacteriota bacterium]|jgi:23S rRNA (adenine2503-C2)-methyltransferase
MDYKKLEKVLEDNKQPAFRFKQITKAVFYDGVSSFDEITTISKDLRKMLSEELDVYPFSVKEVVVSGDKRAIKALFELKDGNVIESVLISPKPDTWSACISSQVGCAMACDFCATGKLGLGRDLTTDEIVSQAVFWRGYLRENDIAGTYTNIVYMGMGEPFMNWENVKESIEALTDESLCNFPNRGVSVSTSGVVPGIEKFADAFGQINLAISLHFAFDEKRDKYMPVNKAYNLERLKKSLQYYLSKNKRRLFIEYIMLNGINDSNEDAIALTKYLRSIGDKKLIIVNLIKYNSIDEGFMPSTAGSVQRFKDLVKRGGIACTIRKSIGDDIHGACGQLAGKNKCD